MCDRQKATIFEEEKSYCQLFQKQKQNQPFLFVFPLKDSKMLAWIFIRKILMQKHYKCCIFSN